MNVLLDRYQHVGASWAKVRNTPTSSMDSASCASLPLCDQDVDGNFYWALYIGSSTSEVCSGRSPRYANQQGPSDPAVEAQASSAGPVVAVASPMAEASGRGEGEEGVAGEEKGGEVRAMRGP